MGLVSDKRIWALAAFTLLVGCATASKSPPVRWIGGDPTHLAADQAVCQREASELDPNQAAGFSDPRYGVTSAMANAIGRDNPLTDQHKAVRLAAFDTCMTDKGWKIADQPLAAADH